MDEKGDELFRFALAEGGSGRRDKKKKLFEVVRGKWGLEKRWRGERGNGSGAVKEVDSVLCVEGEGALVVMVGVRVEEEIVIGACVGEIWEGRRSGGGFVPLGGGRTG